MRALQRDPGRRCRRLARRERQQAGGDGAADDESGRQTTHRSIKAVAD
jgi:hypothetical protein